MDQVQGVPSGSKFQSRILGAGALVGLLVVFGVFGSAAKSYLRHRQEERDRAKPVVSTDGEPSPAAKAKTGGLIAEGGAPKDAKTEGSPKKPVSSPSTGKTPPVPRAAKTDMPPEANKETGTKEKAAKQEKAKQEKAKQEKTEKRPAEPSKPSENSKAKVEPSPTTKESATPVEKAAKSPAEPSKTAKSSAEPSKAAIAKDTPPSDKEKPAPTEPDKSREGGITKGKEKPGDKTTPAREPGESVESGKRASRPATDKPPVVDSGSSEEEEVATIIMHVPADAKVYFDGQPTEQTGTERTFVTPPLSRGKSFGYELKTEFGRGRVTSRTGRITVRAGETIHVEATSDDFRVTSPGAPK